MSDISRIGARWRLTVALNQALHTCNLPALTYEQLVCIADESREPEARGMVMDIADRVITSPTVSDFLHRVLAECLPVDPNDPDEGTAAYGGWDHDGALDGDVIPLTDRLGAPVQVVNLVPEDGPSHPAFTAQMRPTKTHADYATLVHGDPWMAPLVTEFAAWRACEGFTTEDGDAGDILALARITPAQRAWLIDFTTRWAFAENAARHSETTAKGEARAQAVWLDRMGMGPVKVLP